MVFSVKTTQTTILPNGKQTVTRDTSSLAVALRASQQFYSAARIKSKYAGIFNSLAGVLNREIEAVIIKELGGGKIQERTGGFIPDFFIPLEGEDTQLRELKLSATIEQDERVIRRGSVKLGGGEGLTIRPGRLELVTGFVLQEDQITPVAEELPTTRLFNALKKAKDDQAALIKILSGTDRAAVAIRTTLIAKANTIDIPVIFQGRLENRSISFTWKDIQKAVITKKGKITIIDGKDSIKLNFAFFGSTITKALNDIDRVIVRQLNGRLGQAVLQAVAEQISIPGPGVAQEIRQFLREAGLECALQYIPGSAKIVGGTIQLNQRKQPKRSVQRFISNVQWTILTQRRLGETMQRIGIPNPPNLKERTGRFRASIEVAADYKRNLLVYTYEPLYQSLERYGYRPNIQIETAIRDVASSLFTRQFNIRKA
jgi:hypothetical protein